MYECNLNIATSARDDVLTRQHKNRHGNYEDHLLTAGTAFERLVNAHKEVITGLEPSPSENKSELQKTVNIHQSLEDINKSEGKLINGLPGVQLTEEEEEKAVDIVEWKPFVVISEGLCVEHNFLFLRSFFVTLLGLKASKSFFNKFTDSVFNAPMVFFDSTPVGRILTRASSDISVIDFDIPFSFAYVIASSDMGYYQPTAMELMRINGTTKAPVMNYASETSLGVATIQAFKMQDRFFKEYLKLVDTDASTFLFSNATLERFVLRTKAVPCLQTTVVLAFQRKDTVPGFEVEVSSKRTTSSQRDHMNIQRRDTSRHCRKDREWQDNANNSLISFSKA
ncbi:ABC transporter C family member 8-like protein isoform X1 [Tanacetum coccineum]